MKPDLYVSVNGWDKFQHYRDRAPKWIKNYLDLLRRDEYTDLTPATRAVLHGLWLLTASRPAANSVRARSLSAELKMRVTSEHLEALNHAGFITLSASESVPESRNLASTEVETETEKTFRKGPERPLRSVASESERQTAWAGDELAPIGLGASMVDGGAREKVHPDKVSHDPRFRKGDGSATFTGCRRVRTETAESWRRDPLGIDPPPADWPYPPPTAEEIVRARRSRMKLAALGSRVRDRDELDERTSAPDALGAAVEEIRRRRSA